MYEVKKVAIEKVYWKSKMNDWGYMSAINVWDNVQNDLNIRYMAGPRFY